MTAELTLTLNVLPDAEDGVVRIDPSDMRLLGVMAGDILALAGVRTCFARVLPAYMEDRNQRLALVGPLLLRNTGSQSGHRVQVSATRQKPVFAESVTLQVDDDLDHLYLSVRARHLGVGWHERAVIAKDLLSVASLDRNPLYARVMETRPEGLVQIGSGTRFLIIAARPEGKVPGLGGLRDIARTCHALAKARLRTRAANAARAVLLTGPSGCGKARLVTRVAFELDVPVITFDMHQMIDAQLVQNSAETAVSLSEIARRGPAILLFDHLEALTPPEGGAAFPAAAARAALAEAVGMLDEVPVHPGLMAFGVASGPLDVRFRDHPCFDLTLPLDAPNRLEREEILALACRGVPLADNADLAKLAAMTAGATARDLQQLVTTASRLSPEPRLAQEDFLASFRHIDPSAAAEVHCDIPDVSWHDIAGLDETKQLMRETLAWALCHDDKFTASGVRPPHSILLSGGQGTGKTSLARALASVIPLNFIEINCSALSARMAGGAARTLHDCFRLARRKTPCLVFLDDLDVLFETHPDSQETVRPVHPAVAQLLNELDGLALLPGVVVIAATNRPDRLTMDILRPGRFDYAVTLPMPDHAARSRILQIHARKLPLAADVDFERLAGITQSLSPAELANLCNRVGLMAIRASLGGEHGGVIPPVVNAALFEQALRGRKG